MSAPLNDHVVMMALTGIYAVSVEQWGAEVLAFLESAHAKGLVRIVS